VQPPNVILKVLLSIMLETGFLGTICSSQHVAQVGVFGYLVAN
jgi:hypothetical protein